MFKINENMEDRNCIETFMTTWTPQKHLFARGKMALIVGKV